MQAKEKSEYIPLGRASGNLFGSLRFPTGGDASFDWISPTAPTADAVRIRNRQYSLNGKGRGTQIAGIFAQIGEFSVYLVYIIFNLL